MRIGIDARMMQKGQGVGRYINRLIAHLLQRDDTHEYVVFLRQNNWLDLPDHPRLKKVLADIAWYSWREQLVLPWLMWRERVDVMHFPHFNVPLLYPGRFVVTIHDLILIKHAMSATSAASTKNPIIHFFKYLAYRALLFGVVRRACRIITVSQYVKKDIENYLGVAKARIVVTYEAAEIVEVYGGGVLTPAVKKPYLLYVGNSFPHKNLELLLQLGARLSQEGSSLSIVLAGQEDYFSKRLGERINELKLADRILQVGRVEDDVLDQLYRQAHAYVFPSLEEGFGIPPLEAMVRGVLVLASNASCLPEILGDAAIYFDPHDVESLWKAVCASMDGEQAQVLRVAGQAHAAEFSWDRCAQETLSVYTSV